MKTKLTVAAVGLALVLAMSTAPTILSFEPARTIDNPNPDPNGFFGSNDVSAGDLNGDGFRDYVIPGILNDDPDGTAGNDVGRFYTFLGGGSIPSQPTVADSFQETGAGEGGDCFGCTTAIGNYDGTGASDLVIGILAKNVGADGDAGEVRVFLGGADFDAGGAVPATAQIVRSQDTGAAAVDAQFGQSLVLADVAGDTKADIITAAATDVGGNNNQGRVYVYNGVAGPTGTDNTADTTLNAPDAQAEDDTPFLGARVPVFGGTLAAGDFNCDGKADVIVGAPGFDVGGNNNQGRVYVFFGGSATAVDGTVDVTLNTPNAENDGRFGLGLATGDVNGDGCADIVVGAPTEDVGGNADAGRAYLFLGGTTPNNVVDATITHPTGQASAQFGRIVAVGDVNNNGFGDVFVGSPNWDGASGDEGRVFRFNGAPAFDTTLDETLSDPSVEASAFFGRDVKVADLNNDNYGDLIVGARQSAIGGNADTGQAFVFLGSTTALVPTPVVQTAPAISPNPSVTTTPGFRG